jgi:ProP effector
MATDKPTSRSAQAQKTISVLADWFPQCIVLYQWRRKPLKIGIFADLSAATIGAITPDELTAAIRFYCHNGGYLAACIEGAARVDLHGNAVGYVTEAQATRAANILARRQRRKAVAAPPPHPPKRLLLTDLRAAARARREAVS